MNDARVKRSSIPPHKTRPDSPVPTLQGLCDPSQKWRENLRFLPQLEVRLSSIAPNPDEFREAPPNSTLTLTSQRQNLVLCGWGVKNELTSVLWDDLEGWGGGLEGKSKREGIYVDI